MYGALPRGYTLVVGDFEQKMLGSFLGPISYGLSYVCWIFSNKTLDTLLSETIEIFGKILILTTTGAGLVNM